MPPLAVLVPAAALLVLLATAYLHPRGRTEAAIGLAAAAATLATGALDAGELGEEVRHLGPVVVFLVTILVVGDVCGRAGVFAAAAGGVAGWAATTRCPCSRVSSCSRPWSPRRCPSTPPSCCSHLSCWRPQPPPATPRVPVPTPACGWPTPPPCCFLSPT